MRKPRTSSSLNFYHFVWRCNNRHNLLYEDVVKDALVKAIYNSLKNYLVDIVAITIMNNHIHIIMRSPDLDTIKRFAQSVAAGFAPRVRNLQNYTGHIFETRYYLQAINDPLYLVVAMAYVFNNPVKAKMVDSPEKYLYTNFVDVCCSKSKFKHANSKVSCLISKKVRKEIIGDVELSKITREMKPTPIDDLLEVAPHKRISYYVVEKEFRAYVGAVAPNMGAQSREYQQDVVKHLLDMNATRHQIKRVTGLGIYTVYQLADEIRDRERSVA